MKIGPKEEYNIKWEAWKDERVGNRPFSVNRKDNSEMMQLVLEYYIGPIGRVLDLTYGSGGFWRRLPMDWELVAIDKTPDKEALRMTWEEFSQKPLQFGKFDAVVYDPPYTDSSPGAFDLHMVKGYRNMDRHAGKDYDMKYGSGLMTLDLSKALFLCLKRSGLLVYKNLRMVSVPLFQMRDYLIQNLGFQPNGFRFIRPKSRQNHAFWMLFEKNIKRH